MFSPLSLLPYVLSAAALFENECEWNAALSFFLSLVVMSVVLQPQASDNFYQSFVAPAWNGSSRRRKSEIKKNRWKNRREAWVLSKESLSFNTSTIIINIKDSFIHVYIYSNNWVFQKTHSQCSLRFFH